MYDANEGSADHKSEKRHDKFIGPVTVVEVLIVVVVVEELLPLNSPANISSKSSPLFDDGLAEGAPGLLGTAHRNSCENTDKNFAAVCLSKALFGPNSCTLLVSVIPLSYIQSRATRNSGS